MVATTARQGAMTAREIDRLRAETLGCAEVLHFNYAGDSLSPRRVLDTVIRHLEREALIGGYEAEDEAAERIDGIYHSAARLINAAPAEIAIVENATRAWDMAFYSIPFAAGDRILTSVAEYASNVIAFLQMAERGVSIEVIPNDESGQLSVAALGAMLDDRVRLVAVSHMPTNGGLVQPVEEIGKLLRGSHVLFLLDACQTTGQLPLDVETIGCHFLSATSRKYLRGPRGVGFLYVSHTVSDQLTPPFLDMRAATWTGADRFEIQSGARRFENWESNVAGKLGLGTAIDYALAIGLDRIEQRVQRQAERLRQRLNTVSGAEVCDQGCRQGGIVTFRAAGLSGTEIKSALAARRINVSLSTVTSTRFDMEARGLDEVVRASVHYLTTDDEIETLARTLERAIVA
ncbi:MAG: aminotransferase class V-fold PLP-dependent enzyme [Thermomicrobiales bacterium]